MKTQTQDNRDLSFVIGLLTGTFVGAGLVMWFAPRFASELGERASAHFQQARIRVGEAVDELTGKSQARDDAATAVPVHDAAAGNDHITEAGTQSPADRSAFPPHSL